MALGRKSRLNSCFLLYVEMFYILSLLAKLYSGLVAWSILLMRSDFWPDFVSLRLPAMLFSSLWVFCWSMLGWSCLPLKGLGVMWIFVSRYSAVVAFSVVVHLMSK